MSTYFLVLVPVADLEVGDWIMDEHGGRRIAGIRREQQHRRSFISFDDGPSNWYLENELFPTERLS